MCCTLAQNDRGILKLPMQSTIALMTVRMDRERRTVHLQNGKFARPRKKYGREHQSYADGEQSQGSDEKLSERTRSQH